MTCTNRYFLVCRHVCDEGAHAIVYLVPKDLLDGYIVCRQCDESDWHFTTDNWWALCSDCCRENWMQGGKR